MNKHFTLFFTLLFSANLWFFSNINAQNQVANSGFENWEEVYTNEQEPIGWSSFRTNAGTYATLARAKQIDVSPVVRPGTQGATSAVIWARSVVIAIANGNVTTGQIQANSMTPSNINNCNKTIRSTSDFNMPFTARPDSLTIWAKYVPISTANQARISAVIHGDIDYQDPNNNSTMESYVIAKAIADYSATATKGWQRLSIPFDYNSYAENVNNADPMYILISITTNKTPGGGNANDSVYVDDMLMIYNPTLTIENTSGKDIFSSEDMLSVTFSITGTMSPDNLNADANIVSLELSDEFGSFDSPTVLNYVQTDESGEFSVQIPEGLENGDGYKIRVVTTNYPMISEELSITINNTETDLETTNAKNDIFVYPNPVSKILYIECNDVENAAIYTLSANKVSQVEETKNGIDVSNYAAGAYIVNVKTKDGNVHRAIFIKE
ncbi:MAG: PCMD domain-containing protein [Paludibacter sp.]|nr:PCMD domain-containing protein [Paludibacter sp.]